MNNKKYNKKTILDYVSGNDLDGFDIEELENNPNFMADVMKYTMDKRIYCLCSDEVKKNHDFVKQIINIFKDDIEFIIQIADNHINNNCDNNIKEAEINILMGNIYDETTNYDLMKYKLAQGIFYECICLEIENLTAKLDEDEKKYLGKGFCIISDTFSNSTIIKDFFAKRMLNEIFFDDEKYNFEELLHINFKTYEDLEKFGIINFILKYVGNIDSDLSDYLCQNQELLLNVKKELSRVKNRWEGYTDRVNKEKIEMIWDEVYHYRYEHLICYGINYIEFLDRIMSKLRVLDILGITSMKETLKEDYNDEISDEEREFNSLFDKEDLAEFVQIACPPIEKRKFENHMTSYIKELFKTNIIEEPIEENKYQNESNKKEKPKCKIIIYNFQANKNNNQK